MNTRKKKNDPIKKTRKLYKRPTYTLAGPYIINIAHRMDRWSRILKQTTKLGIKPIRINAIYDKKDGATGCFKSHIKALKKWSGEDAIWICEDDCEFKVDKATLHKTIDAFMKSPAVVLCLGYNSYSQKNYNSLFNRTFNNQTATCYIVKGEFVQKLLDIRQHVLAHRIAATESPLKSKFKSLKVFKGDIPEFERNDQCWKLLQQDYIFLIPKIRCAIQNKSFSDIEKKDVNYGV